MKLRYLLPLYLVLGIITYCGRKISDEKEQAEKKQMEIAQVYKPTNTLFFMNTRNITGKIELDTTTNRLYADIWMNVSNAEFKYADDFLLLQTPENFKGIAFQYFNTVNNTPDTGLPSTPMNVVFECNNPNNWQVNDTIRIMSLNEKEHTVFEGLKPYFEERVKKFQNRPITLQELKDFNDEWNRLHPNNHVTTAEAPNEQENYSTGGEEYRIMTPRLTKDGSMLSITLKR